MIKEETDIDLFCDMHGHYNNCGTFMYCNSYEAENGVPPSKYHANANLRVIPFMLGEQNQYFTIRDSKFTMEQYKAASAR